MIVFEHTDVYGFQHAIRGMRQPFKVTDKSDSRWQDIPAIGSDMESVFVIGPKDRDLCQRLNKSGCPHNKFLREIMCWVDITAPLTWWKQFDTYRFGVEKNSESTMHSITKYPFNDSDFSGAIWKETLTHLNELRQRYFELDDFKAKKECWQELIDNLPQSYMQKRTVMISYQAIRSMCQQREGHKLGEWHAFIEWAQTLPESWLIFDDLYNKPNEESNLNERSK